MKTLFYIFSYKKKNFGAMHIVLCLNSYYVTNNILVCFLTVNFVK